MTSSLPLPLDDYRRYGRQMILDGFGLPGQLKLQNASVAVIGAGGLGCPALQYLATSGIGRIGIFDADVVELSNLQRQILHTEQSIGLPKVESAARSLAMLNSRLKIDAVVAAINPSNAEALLASYDVLLDCTDNAPTRYLLSDTAVALGIPLVSGAAQKFEGQLCVYNLGSDGPCYRCLFPVPPAREASGSCEEMGIMGVVTGIIGTMQAVETIKIIAELHDYRPGLLLYSLLGNPPFRSIKLRSRKPSCDGCGSSKNRQLSEIDYIQFCGGPACNWVRTGLLEGRQGTRLTAREFELAAKPSASCRIIDVRPRTEFGICHIPGSINVPLNELTANPAEWITGPELDELYLVCRLGNDSQIAAEAIRSLSSDLHVKDLIGGLRAWATDVDPKFPVY
ncbi:hypothetical protein HGRIS_003664 [Hohenbuehelia grisea]|uniref:Rhodanese domain-containing protein n=1 Tax=Hohenbuehelia grisea TaxID=104357 RepID=A0ABR3JG54_9AGAR